MSLLIWQVTIASERFRYRLLVLILPFFMFPVFQFINPERGSFYFMEDTALFCSSRWLGIQILGLRPLLYFFYGVVGIVSAVVFLQEMVPIFRDWLKKPQEYGSEGRPAGPEIDRLVGEMSKFLEIPKPSVFVVDDQNPIIFTTGTANHSIILSEPLFSLYSPRELKSALAHEIAHIVRRSNITTLLVFVVRICMFFNPIPLLEFRKLVQDDEHICDDITVSVTGDPDALASALKVFCLEIPHSDVFKLSFVKEAIESSSHNLLLQERIERLENNGPFYYHAYGWGRYVLTIMVILAVNYYVV
jgi:Zn-dependent protease with chaperone function